MLRSANVIVISKQIPGTNLHLKIGQFGRSFDAPLWDARVAALVHAAMIEITALERSAGGPNQPFRQSSFECRQLGLSLTIQPNRNMQHFRTVKYNEIKVAFSALDDLMHQVDDMPSWFELRRTAIPGIPLRAYIASGHIDHDQPRFEDQKL